MTESVEYPDLVVVGAGLFGLTVAQQAVEHLGARVEIIDVRDHIGGNAYVEETNDLVAILERAKRGEAKPVAVFN